MGRRRLLQSILLGLATLFLLVLALKFKPKIDTPAPVPPPRPSGRGEGSLSASGFRYVQLSGEKTDFVVTAEEVTETARGEKLLSRPVVVTPLPGGKEERASAARGSLDAATKTLRLYEGAKLESGGWTCESSGFRFTPEGEAVSEGPVTFSREGAKGSAELATYHRLRRRAVLQGSVRLDGEGGRAMRCSRLDLDLEAHRGTMEGPVTFSSPEGTLTSPRGTAQLTRENRLEAFDLLEPVRGEGPRGTLSAKTLRLEADPSGKIKVYRLRGGVHLASAPPEATEVTTESLDLAPSAAGSWSWSAPSALALRGRGEVAHARSGTGTFGAKEGPEAQLKGPVNGTGTQGDFEGENATLRGGAWTLRGDASACRGGDTLHADRLTWRPDGSGVAEGRARGARGGTGGKEPIEFSANRADLAAGGYPILLTGEATATTGGTRLSAPRIEVLSPERALASGGVVAALREAGGGESRLRSERAGFEGDKALAWAQGGVRAEGRNYTLEATRVEAHLDARRRAERLDARGEARFSGDQYDGEGDLVTYTPATESGEVRRDGRDAVVIQKRPYRRLAAPVIRFGPSRLETVGGEGQPARRGRLEGSSPRAGSPAPAPKSTKGGGR